MASTSVVLPWSTCAIIAMFRMDCIRSGSVRRLAGKQKGLPVFRSPASSHSENDKRNELTPFYHTPAQRAQQCAIQRCPKIDVDPSSLSGAELLTSMGSPAVRWELAQVGGR